MKVYHLTPELARYLAEVIDEGSTALGEQSLSERVEEIRQALEQSNGPKSAWRTGDERA
jgi:hypothetical protein